MFLHLCYGFQGTVHFYINNRIKTALIQSTVGWPGQNPACLPCKGQAGQAGIRSGC